MPCSSAGYEPSSYECRIKKTVGLLCYVYGWLDITISGELRKAGNEQIYFSQKQGDKWVNALCDALTNMAEDERDQLVYARCRKSRELANWWEDHVEEDAQRLADEKTKSDRQALQVSGLYKLTHKEKEALDLLGKGFR